MKSIITLCRPCTDASVIVHVEAGILASRHMVLIKMTKHQQKKTRMKNLFFISALLICTQAIAQTVFQTVPNNQSIIFHNNDGTNDNTEIRRFTGNSLRFRYRANHINFDALSNHSVRITNSNGTAKFEFNPNGNSYLNGGNVGIGTTSPTNGLLHIVVPGTTGPFGNVDLSKTGLHVQDQTSNLYMDGNTIYTDNNMLIGTMANKSLSFGTSDTERIKILANGNVGIGISPTAPLTLNGSTASGVADIEVLNEDALISLGENSPGPHGLMFGDGDTGGLQLVYRTTPNQVIIEKANDGSDGDDLFSVDYDTEFGYFKGNVGIGTDSPTSTLDLFGGDSGDVILRLEADADNAGSEADNPRIEMYQDNKLIAASIGFNEDTPTPANIFQIGTYAPDNPHPYSLTIDPYTGNVGLGVVQANNRLEVNGTVRAKKFIAEASPWPDYVFLDTYELRSLEETADFIKANGHLPEVPSAAQVEADGFELAEMNATLLKKVEELTLHQIDLLERLNVQNEKLSFQEETIKSLTARIQNVEKK